MTVTGMLVTAAEVLGRHPYPHAQPKVGLSRAWETIAGALQVLPPSVDLESKMGTTVSPQSWFGPFAPHRSKVMYRAPQPPSQTCRKTSMLGYCHLSRNLPAQCCPSPEKETWIRVPWENMPPCIEDM